MIITRCHTAVLKSGQDDLGGEVRHTVAPSYTAVQYCSTFGKVRVKCKETSYPLERLLRKCNGDSAKNHISRQPARNCNYCERLRGLHVIPSFDLPSPVGLQRKLAQSEPPRDRATLMDCRYERSRFRSSRRAPKPSFCNHFGMVVRHAYPLEDMRATPCVYTPI